MKPDRQPYPLSELIAETVESFHALAEQRGVTVRAQVAAGSDPAQVDAQQISRVLGNLISNALRHTPAGREVTVSARPAGAMIEVAVADSGEGIAAQDLPHIFERFYRGEKSRNRATGGSGLGLAIARAVIEAHGGSIRAESQPGQGARFVFTVPAR